MIDDMMSLRGLKAQRDGRVFRVATKAGRLRAVAASWPGILAAMDADANIELGLAAVAVDEVRRLLAEGSTVRFTGLEPPGAGLEVATMRYRDLPWGRSFAARWYETGRTD